MPRSGSAAANSISGHMAVLDAAAEAMDADFAAGQPPGREMARAWHGHRCRCASEAETLNLWRWRDAHINTLRVHPCRAASPGFHRRAPVFTEACEASGIRPGGIQDGSMPKDTKSCSTRPLMSSRTVRTALIGSFAGSSSFQSS